MTTSPPASPTRDPSKETKRLAKVEGTSHDGRPVVLFLCVHNAGRSQMALGFLQHHAGESVVGWSGGSQPGNVVEAGAVRIVRDDIERRVLRLVDSLCVAAA
ncbi:hypothetical protein [Cellulomonas sp. Leaf334]|uniref:hypothetical protein n=1 Tax=Cellulomonas sp. Leaf334 TaxID=1736339 RepID=UPI0006F4985C|nr:hypothetical protein [Cellulomonas sp. Leaf334]KQR10992.1 hypothetical protein ASF78_15045 [Cellulomonas sp. Leaf334]